MTTQPPAATFSCPICGRQAALTTPLPTLYPFCSDRCKMADLGRWFRGQYTINRELTPEEIADLPPEREA